MSDELLRYYNSELQYLRRQGDQFAQTHPEVAAHLRFGSEGDNDPYVGRLVEAFAYLNARTRLKIEDEFPEIAGSLLDIILPHYQRPIPSVCIAQLALDKSQAEQFDGYQVDRLSAVESDPVNGEPCRFRTCYPVTCWPFTVQDVTLRGVPIEAPSSVHQKQALGLLKITLATFNSNVSFAKFNTSKIRFFINLNSPFSYHFYEMIFSSVLGVSAASSPKDPKAVSLAAGAVQQVGFELDQGLVEYPPQSFPGYRLLSEYFAFPDKFLFFDVDIKGALAKNESSQLELFFYLNKRWQDLEPHIQTDSVRLGCTPIVNLFEKRAEPIRLSHFDSSYTIVPDARRPLAHEIYSIDEVTGLSSSGESREFEPFYSFRHQAQRREHAYWHASRRDLETNSELARGTEMEISFVDLDFDPLEAANWTIDVETTCTNRNLPARLPFATGQLRFHLEGGGAIERIVALTKPTPPLRPPLGQSLRWRVVSHLSLNHLSLVDSDEGALALRELLALYDFRGDETTASSVMGLTNVSGKPIMGRVPGDRSG
ncbi:MAG: type VI secretion system baseplate subunit TssF, partial [Planctomycetales bacterium]|nr:type VI secretion system baseplate subunit TssF [Planctomycetales bacterium]